jgi:hypothetical protein
MTVRRGKGEGSIYQRASDGRWAGIVDLGYVGGKRVRKTVYGKTQREVIAKRKALQASIDSGVVPDNATLEQWITHWLERIAAHRNRPSTLRGYRTYVHQWIIPNLGHIRLSKLTPEHVRALHDAMRRPGSHRRPSGRRTPSSGAASVSQQPSAGHSSTPQPSPADHPYPLRTTPTSMPTRLAGCCSQPCREKTDSDGCAHSCSGSGKARRSVWTGRWCH